MINWLEQLKTEKQLDFDVSRITMSGADFVELTKKDLKELTNCVKSGIVIFNAREKLHREKLHKQSFPEFQVKYGVR